MKKLDQVANSFAMLCAVFLVAGTPALAQNGPFDIPDDHFLCYKGKPDKNIGQVIQKGQTTDLDDQFQVEEHVVKKLRGICNPADKNSEGIVDPNTHLTPWAIKSTGAKHVAQTITTFDQFGLLSLTTAKTDRLLVPSSKSLTAPPPWIVSAPNGADHDVDSFQCYKVKITSGATPFPKGLTVTIDDQFAEPVRTFSVKGPKLFCNPVNVDGGGIQSTEGHLVCYQVKPAKGEPKHAKAGPIQVADQFVAESAVFTAKEDMLCLPAIKNPPAQFCGDKIVNQVSEECDGDASVCPGQTDVCLDDCTCVPARRRCGDGVLEPSFGEQCEIDADCAAGESCSSSCTCIDSQCPDTLDWTQYGDVGALGTTVSDNDSGWKGIAHNNVDADESHLIFRITSVSGSGPSSCGTATVSGVDTDSRMCRCENDVRAVCDQPGERDLDDCGGDLCECYLEAPVPSVSGNIPTCSLTKISGTPTGTWDVDAGSGSVDFLVEQTTSLDFVLLAPCVTCDGDVTLNDGLREGTCSGGDFAGLPCDAQYNDLTFPAPGGGSYSLDCKPKGPTVVNGLFTDIKYSTGSRAISAIVPCMDGSNLCHCGRCDNDIGVPCQLNADCADAGVGGVCGQHTSTNPQPNNCSDQTCTDVGDGEGECLADSSFFCDGLLRANGQGLVGCNTNADCEVGSLGVDGGTCSFEQNRRCYPDSVAVSGEADQSAPVVAALECIAPSANNPSANVTAGYPGLGKRIKQLGSVAKCGGTDGAAYPSCP